MKDFFKELVFDLDAINEGLSKVDKNLKNYIEVNILPEYDLNDGGHNINHINCVLKRAFELAKNYDIDYNILYTAVSFHDIACHIDRDNHEVLSAKKAFEDEFLNEFFGKENMVIISEAIEDHRASLEYVPRNIYGKILSSADRKVEIKEYLNASLSYGLRKNPELNKDESIERSYEFANKKFGRNGYAVSKSYVEDSKYKNYLDDMWYLLDNKDVFISLASKVYDDIIKKQITQ